LGYRKKRLSGQAGSNPALRRKLELFFADEQLIVFLITDRDNPDASRVLVHVVEYPMLPYPQLPVRNGLKCAAGGTTVISRLRPTTASKAAFLPGGGMFPIRAARELVGSLAVSNRRYPPLSPSAFINCINAPVSFFDSQPQPVED
jgi:hypothetical protein